ncbi:MAG: hypothetical protein K2K67_04350 [Treponemataceae bacterium]|nr:hypothetical protein [Treponemataceae bacterium]
MKKHILTAACLATVLALVATACHDVIFDEIRKEVKLTDAQVSGDINSIVEFNGYLYVQNGNILRKELKNKDGTWTAPYDGQWTTASRTGMGSGIVIKLAANDSNLYALVARIEEDEDEGENIVAEQTLYTSTDGSNWTIVSGVTLTRTGNQLYSLDGSAYIRNDNKIIYTLTGENATEGGVAYQIKTGAYTASDKTIYKDGSVFYNNIGSTIYSIALTSDCLIVGTASGLKYVTISSPKEITVANSASALSSYYEVHCVFAASPDRPAQDSDIYATAIFEGTSSNTGASADNQGLWAYYPGRGHWNRE